MFKCIFCLLIAPAFLLPGSSGASPSAALTALAKQTVKMVIPGFSQGTVTNLAPIIANQFCVLNYTYAQIKSNFLDNCMKEMSASDAATVMSVVNPVTNCWKGCGTTYDAEIANIAAAFQTVIQPMMANAYKQCNGNNFDGVYKFVANKMTNATITKVMKAAKTNEGSCAFGCSKTNTAKLINWNYGV